MIYKNLSRTTKTFYGVTFGPGETKEVSGNIVHKDMLPVSNIEISNTTNKTIVESGETIKSVNEETSETKSETTKKKKTSKKTDTVEKTDTEKINETKEGVIENGTDNNK